jgi:hypothetical protein
MQTIKIKQNELIHLQVVDESCEFLFNASVSNPRFRIKKGKKAKVSFLLNTVDLGDQLIPFTKE